MKKFFTLMIMVFFLADIVWSQDFQPGIAKGSAKKTIQKPRSHDPVQPSPLEILQGGENIATAMVISSLPFSETGTTDGYANDYEEACESQLGSAPDVVYSYTPVSDGTITISLCNDATDYDTKLYVYDIPNPQTGDAIACNDDFCGNANFPYEFLSKISNLAVAGGTTYYIVVDGYDVEFGTYEITVNPGSAGPGCGETSLGPLLPTTSPQYFAYLAGDTYYWSFNATAYDTSIFTSCGANEDTYLRIYNADFFEIDFNDDEGPHCVVFNEASIDFVPTVSGQYYVSLAHWTCSNLLNPGNLTYYYKPPNTCTVNTWTGAAGTLWGDPANWSCGVVPDATMIVMIGTGLTNYPVVGSGVTANCYEIILASGVTIVVANGGVLNVINP